MMKERFDREIISIQLNEKEIEKRMRSGYGNFWRCFAIRNVAGYDHMIMIRSSETLPTTTLIPTTSETCSSCGIYSNELYSDGERINNMCADCHGKCG